MACGTIAPVMSTTPAAPPWHRCDALLLALVLLLAFALRLLFWLDQGNAAVVFSGDADEYYRGAVHLYVDGTYFDEGQWLRPPLTSLFWATCFLLLGPSLPLAMLAQCLLGALTALVVGDTARRLLLRRRAGLLAALLAALFLPWASIASQALSETTFIFAVALSLWLLVIMQRRGMQPLWLVALTGAALGTAALARPVGLYAMPFLALWVLWSSRRLAAPLLLVAGFALVVGPWTVRNYLVYEQLVLVDTNGGVSFWFGTLRDPAEQKMQDVWKATLPNSALRQQAALRLGVQNIQADPWRYLSRTRNKVVSLWQLETRLFAGNAATGTTWEEGSLPYALLADGQYVALMLLALLALALSKPVERSWALIGWPLYGTLLSAFTLGHPRLRLPLLVPLLIYAALPLAHPGELLARWRKASRQRRALALALCAAFALTIYSAAYLPFARGQFWLAAARLGGDKAALDRAVAANPEGFMPWLAIGDAYLRQGSAAQALTAYQQAGQLAPRSVYAHARQIPLLLAIGDRAEAQRALDAIAAVDWDNNLFYHWAWDHLAAPPAARIEMSGAAELGAIRGFYRAEQEGGSTYRWAMGQAEVRLVTTGQTPTRVRLRLRAQRPNTPLAVFASDNITSSPLGQVLVGTDWQEVELPLHSLAAGPLLLRLQAPAPIDSWQQPYARSVAIDWIEVQ